MIFNIRCFLKNFEFFIVMLKNEKKLIVIFFMIYFVKNIFINWSFSRNQWKFFSDLYYFLYLTVSIRSRNILIYCLLINLKYCFDVYWVWTYSQKQRKRIATFKCQIHLLHMLQMRSKTKKLAYWYFMFP